MSSLLEDNNVMVVPVKIKRVALVGSVHHLIRKHTNFLQARDCLDRAMQEERTNMLTRTIGQASYYLFGAWATVAIMVGVIAYSTKPSSDCVLESAAAGLMWPMMMIGYSDTYYSMIGVGRTMCNEARRTTRTMHRDYLIGGAR